jgi:drug/metabolite transporter (DMT)-like permease
MLSSRSRIHDPWKEQGPFRSAIFGTVIWIVLALTAAAAASLRESLTKSVVRAGDEYAVACVTTGLAGALLVPVALASAPAMPAASFWPALLAAGVLNSVAAVMIARGVLLSDLSLVAPLQSATPLFMIGTGWLLLGEVPGPGGAAGIVLLVAGAYVLNTRGRQPLLAPLRALAADRGARLFLGVAAIFSVSAAIDKIGVLASAPLLWGAAVHLLIATMLLAVQSRRGRAGDALRVLRRAPRRLGVAGVAVAVGIAAQMSALPLTAAAYVIAVKRTSVLMSVAIGAAYFGEPFAVRRLAGALVMLAGFVLITVSAR